MPSRMRKALTAAAVGSGVLSALLATPNAVADAPLPSNCMPGTYGQVLYCDQDVSPDGSWIRCAESPPESLTVLGGVAGDVVPSGAPDCRAVTPNTLRAGSPPYHIGYGGEATGRV